jgi:radical SAM superfamily enzyme YgiQ (UPF0313 family)
MFGHFLLNAEPLGLEYIAAGVKGLHDVKILDMTLENRLSEVLAEYQPDIVGCTVCTSTVNTSKQILSRVKSFSRNILTVVGGPHATVQPKDLFHHDIDIVVVGEGIDTFKSICENYEGEKGFAAVDGIYYRDNGVMVSTPMKEFPDLNSEPFPDRSLTARYRDKYGLLVTGARPLTLVRGAAGCSYNCSFCTITSTLKGKVYTRDPDSIIEELATIQDDWVFFVDDEFLLDPDRAINLAYGIQKAGINKMFGFFSRSDSILIRPDCIEAWAEIGLKFVMVGMESHRDEDLREYKKGTSISTNEKAFSILQKNKVWMRANYLVRPDFDLSDFKRMQKYVKKSRVELPFFPVLTPLPGTNFYEETKNQLITNNYDLWDLTHTVLPTRLPLKDFYRAYRRLIRRSVTWGDKLRLLKQLDSKTRLELATNWLRMVGRLRGIVKHHD